MSLCMHFGFLQLQKSQLLVRLRPPLPSPSAPPNHSSCRSNRRTSRVTFHIAIQDSQPHHSHRSQFWDLLPPPPPSAAKQCKNRSKVFCRFFMLGSQCCIFLCFVKLWFLNGKSSQRWGPEKKGQLFFFLFFLSFGVFCLKRKNFTFFIQKNEE